MATPPPEHIGIAEIEGFLFPGGDRIGFCDERVECLSGPGEVPLHSTQPNGTEQDGNGPPPRPC